MTEDEAFIRAIVDTPGDDLPRLVYADWLDDRYDPRGPYLRAEREAAETADVARVRQLAVALDPIWVARVSRPPVGVCCDGFVWTERGPTVFAAELDRFENRFGIALAPAYRAFLSNYNGGFVEIAPRVAPENVRASGPRFYPLAGTGQNDPVTSLEHEFAITRHSIYSGTPRENDSFQVRLLDYMIVARAPGNIALVLIGTGTANLGKVRSHRLFPGVVDRPADAVRFDSFPDYLASLSSVRV